MNNDKPLDILIDLAKEKLEDTGRDLAQATAKRNHTQNQLDKLAEYRTDYTKKLRNNTSNGITSANYHNFRRFINTLDEAIRQQKVIIAKIDKELAERRNIWLEQKRRLNSYETLKARQVKAAQIKQQRQEQRASDEISAGVYRRKQQLF